MFKDDVTAVANAAVNKVKFLTTNPLGYFLFSILAGAFVGFGCILSFTISGLLAGLPAAKIVAGAAFGCALSLVVMAGSELFTGNNFVMAVGLFLKKIQLNQAIRLWIICWLGNLVGSILLALCFQWAGLNTDATASAFANAAVAKGSMPVVAMIIRGILCNILVCLAVWCSIKMKSETGKLIMIFWCIFVFFTAGFEHSVANMTTFSVALLAGQGSVLGAVANLFFVTIGNMIGAIGGVALPYYIASKK